SHFRLAFVIARSAQRDEAISAARACASEARLLRFARHDAWRRWRRASLDRQGVDRRADRTGDRDRGGDEQELVDLVGRAVVGELLEIEDLAHGHADDRDRDPVPALSPTAL